MTHNRGHQPSCMQGLGKKDQTAQGMVYPMKVLVEMTSNLRCRIEAGEHIHKAEEGYPKCFISKRPIDHPAHPVLGLKEGWLVLRRFTVQGPC